MRFNLDNIIENIQVISLGVLATVQIPSATFLNQTEMSYQRYIKSETTKNLSIYNQKVKNFEFLTYTYGGSGTGFVLSTIGLAIRERRKR